VGVAQRVPGGPSKAEPGATRIARRLPWTGSWTGVSDNPSAVSAISAITRVIRAASAHDARGRTSCKRQVPGSNPGTGSQVREGKYLQCVSVRGTNDTGRICACSDAKGHIEQLPTGRSGSPCMPGRLNSAVRRRCPCPVARDSCVSIGVVAGSRSCLQKLLTPTRQQRR